MPRPIGAHTKEKLRVIAQYLPPYLQATTKAMERIYIDGFAGPGTNRIKGTGEIVDGSPLIALSSRARNGTVFSRYFFIELNPEAAAELRGVIAERFPNARAEVIDGDVNVQLPKLIRRLPKQSPTFVLLDTEGIEPAWSTVKAIAPWRTELLITFPLGMGIKRNPGPKVTRYYGTEEWRRVWESSGPREVKGLLDFYKARLDELGYRFQSKPDHRIKTDDGKDLYYMVHVSKAEPASRIMGWVSKQPDSKGQLRLPESD